MCGVVHKNSSWRGKGGRICSKGATFQMVNCTSAVLWWVSPLLSLCLSLCLLLLSLCVSSGNKKGGRKKPNLGLTKHRSEELANRNFPGLLGFYYFFFFFFSFWGDYTRKVTFLSSISPLLFCGEIRCDGNSGCCFHLNCTISE